MCDNNNTELPKPLQHKELEEKKEDEYIAKLLDEPHEQLFPEITHPKKRAYVAALALTGTVKRACRIARISRKLPNTAFWKTDEVLQEAIIRAKGMAADLIEDEAYRRAVKGVMKPTGFYKGEPGAYVTEYSDTLLIFLLKGLLPEKYATQRHDVRSTRVNINLTVVQDLIARKALPHHVLHALAQGDNPETVLMAWTSELRQQGEEIPAGLLGDGSG